MKSNKFENSELNNKVKRWVGGANGFDKNRNLQLGILSVFYWRWIYMFFLTLALIRVLIEYSIKKNPRNEWMSDARV